MTVNIQFEINNTFVAIVLNGEILAVHWHQLPQLRTGDGQYRGPINGGMEMLLTFLVHTAHHCLHIDVFPG